MRSTRFLIACGMCARQRLVLNPVCVELVINVFFSCVKTHPHITEFFVAFLQTNYRLFVPCRWSGLEPSGSSAERFHRRSSQDNARDHINARDHQWSAACIAIWFDDPQSLVHPATPRVTPDGIPLQATVGSFPSQDGDKRTEVSTETNAPLKQTNTQIERMLTVCWRAPSSRSTSFSCIGSDVQRTRTCYVTKSF